MRGHRIARAVVLVTGVTLLIGGMTTDSRAAVGFSATASAFGSRVEVTVSQAPLVPNLIDAGGPTAQSSLDSIGNSQAVAALPYPGELLLSLPGLANGLVPQAATVLRGLPGTVVGAAPVAIPDEISELLDRVATAIPYDELTPLFEQAPPLPPYPFAAQADSQKRAASVDLGAGRLDATAEPSEANAVAFIEPGASGVRTAAVRSTSNVSVADDTVIAEATSTLSGLTVGPIEIGSIQSLARMELSSDGTISPTTDFVVRGVRIGALSADLTADGFNIGGVPVPAPIADLLTRVFTGAGVEFEILDEEITETGVVSGALRIRFPISFKGLPPQIEGLGSGEMIVTVGQSIATLTGAPIPSFTPPATLPDAPLAAAPAPQQPTPSAQSPKVSTEDTIASPVAPLPSPTGPIDQVATMPVRSGPDLPIEPFDAAGIYLVIVAGALLTAGSSELLRLLAFRPRTSTDIATNGGTHRWT